MASGGTKLRTEGPPEGCFDHQLTNLRTGSALATCISLPGDIAAINGVHIIRGGPRARSLLTNSARRTRSADIERYVREAVGNCAQGADVTILQTGVSAHSPATEIGEDGVRCASTYRGKRRAFAASILSAFAQAASKRWRTGRLYSTRPLRGPERLPFVDEEAAFMYTCHAPL